MRNNQKMRNLRSEGLIFLESEEIEMGRPLEKAHQQLFSQIDVVVNNKYCLYFQ